MADLLARERAAEQHVRTLLRHGEAPIATLLDAMENYRLLCQESMFDDFGNGSEEKEARLWQAHTDTRRFFHKTLGGLRKQADKRPVETRQFVKLYLQFIKHSSRYYRGHIHKLHTAFGGIPELEVVAHQANLAAANESSQSVLASPELRKKVLDSCHRTLIYLGDLSRYRASEDLDEAPKFEHAIGYYDLACTLRPESGMGHHQQAVIALERREHLRAIYHLYRAMVVSDPHPNAVNNLKLEFDKTNTAWDRGELIQKGSRSDPQAAAKTATGWFVRLHSMCFKGELFRGYDELESEVLGQLTAVVKQMSQHDVDLTGTLYRMIVVNLAAQFNAGEIFKETQTVADQNTFIRFFRFNTKTFTTLLRVFYDDLKTVDMHMGNPGEDVDLAMRLPLLSRRILPTLRLYSAWLLSVTQLLKFLATEDSLLSAVNQFWRLYAKTIDLIAVVFPIWDIEELPEVKYMLEEDVDALGFKPLFDEKTKKVWYDPATDTLKPRFSDRGIARVAPEAELLARVKGLLVDGLYLANDDEDAPMKLRGTRVLHRDAEDVELPPIQQEEAPKAETAAKVVQGTTKNKPLSYAAALAAKVTTKVPETKAPSPKADVTEPAEPPQLNRKDDLLDDTDDNNPVTPPPQLAYNPAVVTDGDESFSALPGSTPDLTPASNYYLQPKPKPIGAERTAVPQGPRDNGTPGVSAIGRQSIGSLWDDNVPTQSSSFPVGLPTGTLSSPARGPSGSGHSRVNSASSIRSRGSQNMGMGIADSWSSLGSAPRGRLPNTNVRRRVNELSSHEEPSMVSPFLFGAGESVWSPGPPLRRSGNSPNG